MSQKTNRKCPRILRNPNKFKPLREIEFTAAKNLMPICRAKACFPQPICNFFASTAHNEYSRRPKAQPDATWL